MFGFFLGRHIIIAVVFMLAIEAISSVQSHGPVLGSWSGVTRLTADCVPNDLWEYILVFEAACKIPFRL